MKIAMNAGLLLPTLTMALVTTPSITVTKRFNVAGGVLTQFTHDSAETVRPSSCMSSRAAHPASSPSLTLTNRPASILSLVAEHAYGRVSLHSSRYGLRGRSACIVLAQRAHVH